MNAILNMIDEIDKHIFDFELKEAMNEISKLTELLINGSANLNDSELNDLSEILYYMNMALENKDYMFYCDILQYELKTFVSGKY